MVTERQLSNHRAAVHNLRRRLADLQDTYAAQHRKMEHQLAQQRLALQRRQRLGQTTARAQKRIDRLRRGRLSLTQRFRRQQRSLLQQLYHYETHSRQLRVRLTHRIALRDAIDTETLCRERDLEKDQVMLNWQILLANLHDWFITQAYFAPQWHNLSLKKVTQMIYRRAGRVTWYNDCIEVVLEPCRYRDQQRAMEVTSARFNAANVRWRDGRLLRISVTSSDEF